MLSELIDEAAARDPQGVAFIQPDGSELTYLQCRDSAHRIAAGLALGEADSSAAATPATCGAAMEVPVASA